MLRGTTCDEIALAARARRGSLMRNLLLLSSFLFFTGCSTYVWLHPEHNDAARFNRDSYECERDMRQSGYYGTGIVGAINAQEFGERCMIARGYYKARREQSGPQKVAMPAAVPTQRSQTNVVSSQPVSQPPTSVAPAPVPVNPAPITQPRFAQLSLVKGRIVSNPPQSFNAEFDDGSGKASVVLAGNRRLEGNFELFEIGTAISAKYKATLIKPDAIKVAPGADRKGFARFSDFGLQLECSYSLLTSTGRGGGVCADSDGNSYQIGF